MYAVASVELQPKDYKPNKPICQPNVSHSKLLDFLKEEFLN